MNNKDKDLDIYLMGIGGTGMGALAGLLKKQGHRVRGSDSAVYSPMREKLAEWEIAYKTPYKEENLSKRPDLVIVGNVIRKDNPEASFMREQGIPCDSFPSALRRLFLSSATSLVASGTHGKTTCSSLMAHTLHHAGRDPGFLIGGIPLNFGESFRASNLKHYPFVVEGDEYDTAYFDKKPKFMHYQPNFLLITSIEFDHGDIYRDLDAVINAFSALLSERGPHDVVVFRQGDQNILSMQQRTSIKAKMLSYGEGGDYEAVGTILEARGISFEVRFRGSLLGHLSISLHGSHNAANALGCYAMLHAYGLKHEEIAGGFASFKGVKRRLEERSNEHGIIRVDDFAHHPSAVRETIKAAKQKYQNKTLWAIFEPRSATSCMKIFEEAYVDAFMDADRVVLAPVGRALASDQMLNTLTIAEKLKARGLKADAFHSYDAMKETLENAEHGDVFLFMSNGDFGGHLKSLLVPNG